MATSMGFRCIPRCDKRNALWPWVGVDRIGVLFWLVALARDRPWMVVMAVFASLQQMLLKDGSHIRPLRRFSPPQPSNQLVVGDIGAVSHTTLKRRNGAHSRRASAHHRR